MNAMLKGLATMSAFVATANAKKNEKGAAFTEYVVLVAVVVAMVVAVLLALQTPLNNAITRVATAINGAGGGGTP